MLSKIMVSLNKRLCFFTSFFSLLCQHFGSCSHHFVQAKATVVQQNNNLFLFLSFIYFLLPLLLFPFHCLLVLFVPFDISLHFFSFLSPQYLLLSFFFFFIHLSPPPFFISPLFISLYFTNHYFLISLRFSSY